MKRSLNKEFLFGLCTFCLFIGLLLSCSNDDNVKTPNEKFEIHEISFPNPPILIETNEGASKQRINYFNIIKVQDGKYYMYYSAFENDVPMNTDWNQNLYFAYSEDGFHYTHKSIDGGDNLIMRNVVENYAFMIPGNKSPFRIIANVRRPESERILWTDRDLCMWESKDGFHFDNKKVLLNDTVRDTQNVMLVNDNHLMLYARSWEWRNIEGTYRVVNRRIAVCKFDFDGNKVSDMELLPLNFIYNSAASQYKGNVLLFPTHFNEILGEDDSCYITNYVVDGTNCKELYCDFNKWVKEDEKWVSFSPGVIEIDGKNYIGYLTVSKSHDNQHDNMVSKFKLIEIVIK